MKGYQVGNSSSLPTGYVPPNQKRKSMLIDRMLEEETVNAMWVKGHELLLDALKIHPSYERLAKFLTFDQFLLHLGSKPLKTD
jgi:hypothetical protein